MVKLLNAFNSIRGAAVDILIDKMHNSQLENYGHLLESYDLTNEDKTKIYEQINIIKKIFAHKLINIDLKSIEINDNLVTYNFKPYQVMKLYDELRSIKSYIYEFLNVNSKVEFNKDNLAITTVYNYKLDLTMPESFDKITLGVNQFDLKNIELDHLDSMIISGQPRSGKTTLVNNIIKTLPANTELKLIVDRKLEYNDNQCNKEFIENDEQYDFFVNMCEERNRRLNLTQNELDQLNPICIIIDDYANFITQNESNYRIEPIINDIMHKAYLTKISIIFVIARPSADVFSPNIKFKINHRIAFKTIDGMNSNIIIDSEHASKLKDVGEFIYKTPNKDLIKGHAYYNKKEKL